MQTQVKERLTGAVILVALVVLLVPELLSGSGPRAEPAAPSRAGEPPMRSYTIDLAEGGARQSATPVPVPASASRPEPLEARVLPTPQKTLPAAKPKADEKVEIEKPAVPVQPPPARVATAAPRFTSGWSVQLGSFQSRDNAQRLVRELKGKGFDAFVLEGGGKSGRLYRVRVGPEPDRAAASALAAKLRAAGQPGSVVPPP